MISSRLIYIPQTIPFDNLAAVAEQIDLFIEKFKYLEIVDNHLYIYGNSAGKDFLVGREITGREEEAYHHESIKIKDYEVGDFEKKIFESESFEGLLSSLQGEMNSFTQFRIRWDISKPNTFETYFF